MYCVVSLCDCVKAWGQLLGELESAYMRRITAFRLEVRAHYELVSACRIRAEADPVWRQRRSDG